MKYPDSIGAAFNEIKAWKTACLILGLISCVLGAALAYNSVKAPAYLIPYDFALSKGRIKVEPGKAPQEDYLQTIAFADLGLLLTWNPNNVQLQIARFLNRLTPNLYAAQSVKLSQDATKSARDIVSQVFYPNQTEVDGYTIRIKGSLVRWKGSDEVARATVAYQIRYHESGGFLQIDDIEMQ